MPADAASGSPRRITFLMQNSYGSGGIARTVTTLANQLAEDHEVEVISLFRWRPTPSYPLDPRIVDTCLFDRGAGRRAAPMPRDDPGAPARDRREDCEPSVLYDGHSEKNPASAHTDRVLRRTLRRLRPGVLVSTRPSLHLASARWAPARVVRVAQDHMNYPWRVRDPEMIATLDEAARRLDAFVTLTFDDERDYRERWSRGRAARTRVVRIPNASPFEPVEAPPPTDDAGAAAPKVLLGAGRVERRKGFHRLIKAYVPLAAEFPDWRLRIYGKGPWEDRLAALVDKLGVADRVELCGHTDRFDEVLAGADCYALSSFHEGLPMVLLEAQASGLPVVSFDCPRGPADLVHDGVDGRLVPNGDVAALRAALREVMGDPALRASMGAAGRRNAEHYRTGAVLRQWETLFGELAAARPRVLRPATLAPRSAPAPASGSAPSQ